MNNRVSGLDFLRYLSLLSVIANHFFDVLQNLGYAVVRPLMVERFCELGIAYFFVSSAFLITILFLEEHKKTGNFSLSKFLARRGLRLLPAYLFLVLLVYFVVYRVPFFYLDQQPEQYFFTTHDSIFNFLFLAPQVNEFFNPSAPYLFHTWTLGMEFQFYLFAGLLFYYFRKRYLLCWSLLLILVVAFIIIHQSPGRNLKTHGFGFLNTLGVYLVYSQVHLFATGVICAFIFKWIAPQKSTTKSMVYALSGFLVVFIDYLAYSSVILNNIWPGAVVFLLMLTVLRSQKYLSLFKYQRITKFLGNISYGAYLFHYIIMVVVIKTLSGFLNLANTGNIILALLAVFIACTIGGAISYNFIEKPFLRIKKRYTVLPE